MTPDIKTIVNRIYDILLHGEGGGSERRRQLEEYVARVAMPEGTVSARFIINRGDKQLIVYWDRANIEELGATPRDAADLEYEEQCRRMND